MPYALEITDIFTWTVRIQGQLVDISCTHLALLPCSLHSVSSVSEVIQALESSHFCIGNDDSKYSPLQASRKGVFMDAAGA